MGIRPSGLAAVGPACLRARRLSGTTDHGWPLRESCARKPPLSREAKVAYAEIQKGVSQLTRSVAEIHRSLRKAEQRIEADARARIRDLRKEARTQLAVVQSKRQEAARSLRSLSTAAGDSWQDIKESADSILSDARATASSVVERFRSALKP